MPDTNRHPTAPRNCDDSLMQRYKHQSSQKNSDQGVVTNPCAVLDVRYHASQLVSRSTDTQCCLICHLVVQH